MWIPYFWSQVHQGMAVDGVLNLSKFIYFFIKETNGIDKKDGPVNGEGM